MALNSMPCGVPALCAFLPQVDRTAYSTFTFTLDRMKSTASLMYTLELGERIAADCNRAIDDYQAGAIGDA